MPPATKRICYFAMMAFLLCNFAIGQEPEDPEGPNDPTEQQLAIRSEAIGWKAEMEFNKEMAESQREDCHTKKQEAMDMYMDVITRMNENERKFFLSKMGTADSQYESGDFQYAGGQRLEHIGDPKFNVAQDWWDEGKYEEACALFAEASKSLEGAGNAYKAAHKYYLSAFGYYADALEYAEGFAPPPGTGNQRPVSFQEPEDPEDPNDPTEQQLAIRSEAIGHKAESEFLYEMVDSLKLEMQKLKWAMLDRWGKVHDRCTQEQIDMFHRLVNAGDEFRDEGDDKWIDAVQADDLGDLYFNPAEDKWEEGKFDEACQLYPTATEKYKKAVRDFKAAQEAYENAMDRYGEALEMLESIIIPEDNIA